MKLRKSWNIDLPIKPISQVNLVVTHSSPLIVAMFSNVITYYVFRLVDAMATKKCEIHLGEVFLQLFSIVMDFTI